MRCCTYRSSRSKIDRNSGSPSGRKALLANLNEVTGSSNRRPVSRLLGRVNALVATQAPKIDQITEELVLVTRHTDSAIQKIGPLVDHADATVSNLDLTIDQRRDPIRQDLTDQTK
jgi:ABC-type transporter Mla subunit MlaD